MANDVKWSDWRSSEINDRQPEAAGTNPRAALLQLLCCLVGLGVLAVVLPGPASWVGLLNCLPTGTSGPVSIGATAESAILVTAAVLVWALLAWVLAVWIAAVASRLPGLPGRCGRALLRRIAPATAGRIIAAAVGVSLLAGTSACAVPAMSDPGSGASTEVAAGSTTASAPAPLGGGAGVVDSATSTASATAPTSSTADTLDGVIASITIDWPAPESRAGTVDTPAPAETAAAADTATTSAPSAGPSTTAPAADATDAPQAPTNAAPTTAAPVTAAPTTAAPPSSDDDVARDPSPPAAPTAPEPRPAGADSSGEVAVRSGDTLWSIAHHQLNPDATDQEIDTAWRAWYSANAQVIGDNPDLIQPGQLLLPPDPEMGR